MKEPLRDIRFQTVPEILLALRRSVLASLTAIASARPGVSGGFGGGGFGSSGFGGSAPQYGAPAQAPKAPSTSSTPTETLQNRIHQGTYTSTPTVPEIALPPPDEQKTLIYVLVKKPEEAPEINIPTPAPTTPSKPEVYFIRYKTQKQEGYAPSQPSSGLY
ncbi:hypothetical protein L9F63_026060, partial [Diploptera punctata]